MLAWLSSIWRSGGIARSGDRPPTGHDERLQLRRRLGILLGVAGASPAGREHAMDTADLFSTGVPWLDRLLGQLRIGENVVWEVEAGAPTEEFMRAFIQAGVGGDGRAVYVSFNHSPVTMREKLGRLFEESQSLLVDCFTDGKGHGDPVFARFYDTATEKDLAHVVRVREPGEVEAFTTAINAIEGEAGSGARYVFDSLTGMDDLWADPARAYRFFTYACPRLYDLGTVAYWILEKEAHTPSFRANLKHVTQVAIDLSHSERGQTLQVVKAEGRALGADEELPQRYELEGGELRLAADSRRELLRLGKAIRAARLKRGLSQAELGTLLGVTASTVSQAEHGLIALSLTNLFRLAHEVELNLAPVLMPRESSRDAVTVIRERDRARVQIGGSRRKPVWAESLGETETEGDLQPMLVIMPPGARLGKHFSLRKGAEFGLMLTGELEVEVAGQSRTLRAGDAIYLDRDTPSAWSNVGTDEASLVWVVVSR
jgi:transcriptional regulator with XRE-family HTH domain